MSFFLFLFGLLLGGGVAAQCAERTRIRDYRSAYKAGHDLGYLQGVTEQKTLQERRRHSIRQVSSIPH